MTAPAPEVKYTDRDVRENEQLVLLAIEYVENYTGDFQYLIDMKMRMASGAGLTTPMVKGILNCMRADPRVTGLPSPLPPEEGVVVELRPKKEKRKRYVSNIECPDVENRVEHDGHSYEDDERRGYCRGWHRINRDHQGVDMAVKIHRPYALARGGSMIHLVGDMDRCAIRWYPNPHAWGFRDRDPDLMVKTACKYPSFLQNPQTLTVYQAECVLELNTENIGWCRHCREVMRDFR